MPLFPHDYPPEFYENLIHGGCLRNIQDATAGNGTLAFICVRDGIGYFGFGCTQEHCNMLFQRVEDLMLAEFANPSSDHYKPQYSKAINDIKQRTAPKLKLDPTPTPLPPIDEQAEPGMGFTARGPPPTTKECNQSINQQGANPLRDLA